MGTGEKDFELRLASSFPGFKKTGGGFREKGALLLFQLMLSYK